MKLWRYSVAFLMLTLFIPRAYAFTYDISTNVDKNSVSSGTETEIKVSLENIQGTSDGIATCSLNIKFDNNILLNQSVRTVGSWSMTFGEFYLFDTGQPVTSNSSLFIVPVKVNGDGAVRFVDIECSDGNTKEVLNDKVVNFTTIKNSNNNVGNNNHGNSNANSNNQQNSNVIKPDIKDSNCDLENIELSEGTLDFEPGVTEYDLEISDIDNFVVTPVLASATSNYTTDLSNNKFIIKVTAEDGSSKVYTIFLHQKLNEETKDNTEDLGNDYTPIFITILFVLILINVVRIIYNIKKKG